MVRRAKCCCKRVSISVAGDALINGLCHCDDCRRRTGSAFGWSAYFRDDQIMKKGGEAIAYAVHGYHPQDRYFCPHCGSTLYWETNALPELTGIAGGNFVAAPLPEPNLSLNTDQSCAWVRLPEYWDQRI